jgi:hypothetical protein
VVDLRKYPTNGYFLQSSRWKATSLCRIPNDDPQKDNLHKPIFGIDREHGYWIVGF